MATLTPTGRSKPRCSLIDYRTFPPATDIEVWAPSIYQTCCNAVPLRQPFRHIAVASACRAPHPSPTATPGAPSRCTPAHDKAEPTNVASHITIDETVTNADTCHIAASPMCCEVRRRSGKREARDSGEKVGMQVLLPLSREEEGTVIMGKEIDEPSHDRLVGFWDWPR